MRKLAPGGKALLKKALEAIKAHPESFDMGGWMAHDFTVKRPHKPYCGTTACLAGHIVLAAGFPAIDVGAYEIAALPASRRALAKKANTGGYPRLRAERGHLVRSNDYATISDLATYLVVGNDPDEQVEMESALFYGNERTHAEIARTVDRWLKRVGA